MNSNKKELLKCVKILKKFLCTLDDDQIVSIRIGTSPFKKPKGSYFTYRFKDDEANRVIEFVVEYKEK